MNPITSEKSQLGFVGVGYMGRPIAQRLLKSGFKVLAYDRDRTQSAQGQEQDFSAVILEMEKRAHLGSADKARTPDISDS